MSNFVEDASSVDLTGDLVVESLNIPSDFEEVLSGPLPKAWYSAEIIEGYATRRGTQFVTEDVLSKKGDSRNLVLCFAVTPPKGDVRNLFTRINYRPSDLTAQRMAFIAEVRKEYSGVKGAWPGHRDEQRANMLLVNLDHLSKATGASVQIRGGALVPASLLGKKLDVHLTINEEGYNEINNYAKAGQFTATPTKTRTKN